MNEALLRELVPAVIGILVRRGADFASAEDAVQEALVRALVAWPDDPPRDPKGWLVTAAWRRFVDDARSQSARRVREEVVYGEPAPGPVPDADDTLALYFLCANPVLPASSAVALTLRAVGGLTTAQIASAYLVPEATMAQRISRAKRRLAGEPLDRPGDLATVLRVLYLVFNEGYSGDVDLAAEAIRITRQLAALTDEPEVAGLLALMLLHHARRASRIGPDGRLVALDRQDRTLWDTRLIAEGVATACKRAAGDGERGKRPARRAADVRRDVFRARRPCRAGEPADGNGPCTPTPQPDCALCSLVQAEQPRRYKPSRKVRTSQGEVVGNADPGKPAGKCHRNNTA